MNGTSFQRCFPLEDISIRSGGDGRTVDAYAAVFNTPTEIHDQDGHYNEEIDRTAFHRTLTQLAPAGSRANWRVGVFYNHGRTLYGTPSERGSVPIGTPLEITADKRGLRTTTRYNKTELADEVLESIRSGAITGQSFQGAFLRSDPGTRPRGGWRADRSGNLQTVRRTEIALREYGPTPIPAYPDAAILGVRTTQQIARLLADLDEDQRSELIDMLRTGTPLETPAQGEPAGPPAVGDPNPGSATEDSPHGHSARQQIAWNKLRAEMKARRAKS
jgi:HK97 family phage prohead protease